MESSSQVEVDGEHRIFQDRLLERLVGKWNVTGKAAGQKIEQYCEADWVLNHQFLRLYLSTWLLERERAEESLDVQSMRRWSSLALIT